MTCILLYDRCFENYRIYLDPATYVIHNTFEDALLYIKRFPQLREVPVNSKPGQRILRGIGSQTTQL